MASQSSAKLVLWCLNGVHNTEDDGAQRRWSSRQQAMACLADCHMRLKLPHDPVTTVRAIWKCPRALEHCRASWPF